MRNVSRVFRARGIVVDHNRVTHPLAARARNGLEVFKRLGTAALTPNESRELSCEKNSDFVKEAEKAIFLKTPVGVGDKTCVTQSDRAVH